MREYFDLDISLLQNAVKWSVDFVKKAAMIYENYLPNDLRPQYAIAAAIEFQETGKRTNILRSIAMDAYRASRETQIVQVSYAANAASLIAALAYTHPFKDRKQARHILGPIIYATLAKEIQHQDFENSDNEIKNAILQTDERIKNLLLKYPRQELGKNRIDELFYKLDYGIINRNH